MQKVIGVDLGGGSVKVGIVDSEGKISGKITKEIKPSFSGKDIADRVVEAIKEINGADIEVIGLGRPGPIELGKDFRIPNLPGLKNFNLKGAIEKEFPGKKVVMEKDADVAALAEWKFGIGKEKHIHSLIVLTLGTGVGSGVIIEGKLIKPTELGHIMIDSSSSAPYCGCGKQGCAESFISTPVIRNLYFSLGKVAPRNISTKVEGLEEINPESIAKKAREGDKICQMVYEKVGLYLGRLIVQIKRFYQPEIIILSGGISLAWDLFEPRLFKELENDKYLSNPEVYPSKLRDAGILGAGVIALDTLKI